MLAEVRQDNKENDAEHMKPVSTNAPIVRMERKSVLTIRLDEVMNCILHHCTLHILHSIAPSEACHICTILNTHNPIPPSILLHTHINDHSQGSYFFAFPYWL
jgi:hypothetical protein